MLTVTVPPKYQVVIPQTIRKQLRSKTVLKIQIIHYEDRLEFISLNRIDEMSGFFKRY